MAGHVSVGAGGAVAGHGAEDQLGVYGYEVVESDP